MGLRETLIRLAEPDLTGDPRAAARFDAAAGSLVETLRGWLGTAEGAGPSPSRRFDATLHETGYPPRQVAALDIMLPGFSVTVRPVAALVVAAAGRMDMARADGSGPTLMLLLEAEGSGRWRAGWRGEDGFLPLDRSGFLTALETLAAGPAAGTGSSPA